ncbi:hypothetical protein HBA54_09435 [Pelagibius litoralis]|uniref:Uncharacterized protein n=1 Tax=Pelagibius litoralis TaxID=374515 RepID=A0A967C928_9PROT|nr:hypothetical protein [Pelagibius litoralis]NIA68812.1 hypothetical protein [Pelagibius litoralis]
MTQYRFSVPKTALAALAVLLSSTAASQAGPFGASESVATPGGGNNSFVQLKQISGFTGNMGFNYIGDSAYVPAGTAFNKFIKLRFSVNCPANYRVHEAGIRVRGNDVFNYEFELVSPGDLPYDQNTWEQALEQEPWDFDKVVSTGIAAIEDAGNNGPVYVSLDKELDSRTEFYGSCSASQPSSGLPFLYYDSHAENGDLRPMTRVRYQLQNSFVMSTGQQLKAANGNTTAEPREIKRLRHRKPAVVAVPVLKTPAFKATGGCPYDCPPPVMKQRKVQ